MGGASGEAGGRGNPPLQVKGGIELRKWLFCLWWRYKHRNWEDTRQKRKALEKECYKRGLH